MADVFISYKRGTRGKVQALARMLQTLEISIWYDSELLPDEVFRNKITDELDAASAAIVCFTASCFDSSDRGWVEWEAGRALDAGKLIVTTLEDFELVPPFHKLQKAPLKDWFVPLDSNDLWRCDPWDFPHWITVVKSLERKLDRVDLSEAASLIAKADVNRAAIWATEHPNDPLAPKLVGIAAKVLEELTAREIGLRRNGHAGPIGQESESSPAVQLPADADEEDNWQKIRDSDDPRDFVAHFEKWPVGRYAAVCRERGGLL